MSLDLRSAASSAASSAATSTTAHHDPAHNPDLGITAEPADTGSSTLISLPVQAPGRPATANGAGPVAASTGPAAPRHSASVARLAEQFNARWVDEGSVAAWAAEGGDRVLLLAGDAVRFPEGQDVAAVLPELLRGVATPLAIAVASQDREDAIARRYGVQRWPSLLFLRDGAYVATVSGMHDWLPFVDLVKQALAKPASRAPGIGIPLVSAGGGTGAASCH
jgi:hydrogenase-1 operon protein HyaE